MTVISANAANCGSLTPIGPSRHQAVHVDFARGMPYGSPRPASLMAKTSRPFHSTSGPATKIDHMWATVRREAKTIAKSDRAMARFVSSAILDQGRLEDVIATRIAQRLATPDVGIEAIRDAFQEALADEPSIGDTMRADLAAVCERDPACERYAEPLLYFKGYHALQTHRLAHWLWSRRRRDLALWLQSRSSDAFQTDINPAARIGKGILLDHATGLVIGSTAVVEDDVSILHEVTLGGTGKESGDRHPKIKRGVLIGAGAKILGNITVGAGAKVAAGSVVLHEVPANTTVAGVPARVVGSAGPAAPAHTMDQMLAEEA